MAEVSLFVGPSGHGMSPESLQGAVDHVLPPARRGDIDLLLKASREPGVLILCDGVFQIAPAVSHAELCRALDAGWQVWGVSSLGAIRAHELRTEGMRGFGYVHAQFDRYEDFNDDEMCLLHFPQAPYFQVTEALVNLRYALEEQSLPLGISTAAGQRLLVELRRLWFGERTDERMLSIMRGPAAMAEAPATALLQWLRQNRIKNLDLAALLAQRPWCVGSRGNRPD